MHGNAYTVDKQRTDVHYEDMGAPNAYPLKQEYEYIGGYMGDKLADNDAERSPGPADYSLKSMRQSHDGYSFGGTQKHGFKFLDFPEPTTTHTKKKTKQKSGKVGKAKRGQSVRHDHVPGPGSYANRTTIGKHGWAMHGRQGHAIHGIEVGHPPHGIDLVHHPHGFEVGHHPHGIEVDHPPHGFEVGPPPHGIEVGPPLYLPEIRHHSPPHPIEVRHERVMVEEVPDLAVYHPIEDLTETRVTTTTQFVPYRHPGLVNNEPGPGSYDQRSTFIQNEARIEARDDEPSPVDYQKICDATQSKPKSAKFSKAERITRHHVDSSEPGAGQYEINTVKSTIGGAIGRDDRRSYSPQEEGHKVAPGEYDHKSTLNQNGWTIGGRHRSASRTEEPGPASYDPNRHATSPSYTMQGKYSKKVKHEELSPAMYHPIDDLTKPRVKGPRFVQEEEAKARTTDEPGPGAYEHKSTISKKGARIGVRYEDPDYALHGPSPGDYEIDSHPTKSRPKSAKFSKEERMRHQNGSEPGAGHYEVELAKNTIGGAIGQEERKPYSPDRGYSASPGSYDHKSSLNQNG